MKNEVHRKIFFYSTFLILLVLSVITTIPFIESLIGGMILAFVFHPLYRRLPGGKRFRALIIVLISISVVVIPTIFIISQVAKEATITYISAQQLILSAKNSCNGCLVEKILGNAQVKFYLNDSLSKISTFIAEKVSSLFVSLPKVAVSIFLLLVSLFYFLKDDDKILKKMKKIVPLKEQSKKIIFRQFEGMTKAVVYGYLVSAISQGAVALIGFYAINIIHGSALIYAPILLAVLLTLMSLLPLIGSGIIWVPLVLYIILKTYANNDYLGLGLGIALLIYCVIIVSNIDNIIRPLVTGVKSKVHPLVILIGIFGGLYVFGIMGLLIGPLILALLLTYLKIYEEGLI